jgi:hypothetical protein
MTFTYDAIGVTKPVSARTTFVYDDSTSRAKIVQPTNLCTNMVYDSRPYCEIH